jgi:DNA modification methylase
MWHVAGSLLEEAPRYTLTTGGPNDASVGEMMTLDEAQNVSMLDQIVTGDARALSAHIPDASVDLIFTDPVYQQIDDYRWLAETALRVLTPHGRVLTWCSKPKLGRCQLAMEDAGLEYVYTLDYTVQAKTFRMRWYNLFCWTTPCLWFQRPGEATKPRKWIPDTYIDSIILDDDEPVDVRAVLPDTFISTAGPSGSYIWNKNLGVLKAWLDVFSAPGETIYDPFTGSGSVPLVCRMLGRHFYASEIRSEVAQQTSERIASMPEPMFLDEVA